MDPKNIKLVLAYDGTGYHGWQRQTNAITIQEVIETKIEMIVGNPVTLISSGRTDAGVHALCQVCNFITTSHIDPLSLKRALNSLLPEDILVKEAEYVDLEFHARYSAKSKIYEYRILNRKEPDPFLRYYLWHVPMDLNTKEMTQCLPHILGTRDFSSFRSSGSGNRNPVRTVMRAELLNGSDGLLRFIIEADGFLRHMVRNIVGTFIHVGLGKAGSEGFRKITESRDRNAAGIKAPPQGLFLMKVHYQPSRSGPSREDRTVL
ncbi:MAG: tRNA pseudouridine(38-40) synthase TruA [Thermodesulfobacteriota bacterium]|nr:tRNA pseudouridine(38-40) synthase TruA [Thermodesulfobacteriota bacterium]